MSAETQPPREKRIERSQPRLFISHRTADREIADVIRHFVTFQSGNEVLVHQSSSAEARTPKIGHNVNRELRAWLWKTDVLLLIYTRHDLDWDYCMWECGVATHSESEDTSVIVLQCAEQRPRVFADQLAVDIRDREKVRRFVNAFLTEPGFFPGRNEPLTRFQSNDTNIARAAQALYDDLKKVVEKVVPLDPDDKVEQWATMPFVRLGLTGSQVQQIVEEEDDQRAQLTTERLLLDASVLTGDGDAAALFGMPTLPPNEPFGQVFKRAVREGESPDWLKSLSEQVTRAAQWNYPAVGWSLMRSANENDHTWYSPVLTHVQRSPTKDMEFAIHFLRFSGAAGAQAISIPLPDDAPRGTDGSGAPGE
ncbi:MAG: toll/interleukin-1 receptor domain-containing protein [Actinomycetota bacterium]|nr:toll/interleukin-1 receptor domain-containing protein [Actinomycetota bacterium]